jgi:hypothetical protein
MALQGGAVVQLASLLRIFARSAAPFVVIGGRSWPPPPRCGRWPKVDGGKRHG